MDPLEQGLGFACLVCIAGDDCLIVRPQVRLARVECCSSPGSTVIVSWFLPRSDFSVISGSAIGPEEVIWASDDREAISRDTIIGKATVIDAVRYDSRMLHNLSHALGFVSGHCPPRAPRRSRMPTQSLPSGAATPNQRSSCSLRSSWGMSTAVPLSAASV